MAGQHWFEGNHDARGLRFAIVVSRFNREITDRLLEGAMEALLQNGCTGDDVEVWHVPGAWELAVVAAELAKQNRHEGIICLGAVVRGGTPHFEYVAGGAARGLQDVARESRIPVTFGVLTTNDMEQAFERAGGAGGNKGHDAAMTAIEMANLMKALRARIG